MKREVFKTNEAVAIQRGAMETETIQKNGASSKSLMSRRNFLVTLCGALLAAGVVFSGCEKDKDDGLVSSAFDGKITATLEKGGETYNYLNSKVNKVSAEIGRDEEILASGTYANGGFTLTLPQPTAKYFETNGDENDAPVAGINVSDKNAKISEPIKDIIAYDSVSYDYGDELYYGKVDKNSETEVSFMYADRDVTITGSSQDEYNGIKYETLYSISLKKG